MTDIIMYLSAILSVALVIYMLAKKMDIKITLFFMGILLMVIAMLLGNEIVGIEEGTGFKWIDPILAIVDSFKSTLTRAGFIILMLGGYAAYMSHIKANEVTVSVLTKPLKKINNVYILVPIVFLIGNLLSLVIPSASNLAIILLATLYPILRAAKMPVLTIGALIATAATIIPTPLGGDNVAVANELATYANFSGLTVTEYVLKYHAIVSIPTLLLIAVVHYFWQKHSDKKDGNRLKATDDVEIKEVEAIEGGKLYKTVYGLLPVLPIILLITVFMLDVLAGVQVALSVEIATILSLIVAIVCEMVRVRKMKPVLDSTETFFKGMGGAMPIVALLVAASVFVRGLQSIGLIDALQTAMLGADASSQGFILPLILVALTALIVIISGSGVALFYAMVPLMVPLADAAGINPIAITVPMGLAGNLLRAVSPVAAVIMIISGSLKVTPLAIVKRTAVPMLSGVVFMFILSMLFFL